jgi:steroid delta-isomerase-like uncharacterized protein
MDIVEAIDHRGRGGSAMRRFRYGQRWMIASLAVPMLAGVLVVSSATGVIRAQSTETPTLEEIAARYGLEIWGAGNLQTLESLFADDVVDHNAFPGQAPGREGIEETLVAYRAAFPNLTLTNDDIVVGSDRVVLRWTARGTHEGELMGIPASGAEVTMTGIDILRVENGKVVERWGEFNGLELMQQIGVVAS